MSVQQSRQFSEVEDDACQLVPCEWEGGALIMGMKSK